MSSRYRSLTSNSVSERLFTLNIQPQTGPGTSTNNQANIAFIGTSGQDFTVFWEAGVSNTYTHTGSVLRVTHTYTNTDPKSISVQGAMGKLADPSVAGSIPPDYASITSWGNVTLIADQSGLGTYANLIQAGQPDGLSPPTSSYTDWPLLVANSNCTQMFSGQSAGTFAPRLDTDPLRSAGFGWPSYITGNIINMSSMFNSAFGKSQTGIGSVSKRTASLNGWDTGNVTNMNSCFAGSGYINKLSNWNTINVTDMGSMFANIRPDEIVATDALFVTSSTQQIGDVGIDQWNVSNVANMSLMFENTSGNLGNLSQWNTQSVTNLSGTFSKSNVEPFVAWNTGNVTTLSDTFFGAEGNIDCSGWNTINVTNMSKTFGTNFGYVFPLGAFVNKSKVKRDLSGWNVSNVTNMANIMNGYNGDPQIDSWDVSSVTDMSYAFGAAYLRTSDPGGNPINADYNSSITMDPSGWVTNSLTTAQNTFSGSTLNSNLGAWNLSSITTMANMLDDSAMSTENYSKTLIGWANFVSNAGGSPSSITLGAANVTYNNTTYTGSPYNDAVAARAYLVSSGGSNPGWTITDGGQA